MSTLRDPRPPGSTTDVVVRKLDLNGKPLIEKALQEMDWSPMYDLQSSDDVNYFNTTLLGLLDKFMLTRLSLRHSRDKTWVDDKFRYLIWRRQFAWRNGLPEYRVYRNKVQRAAKRLHERFCQKRLQNLHRSDSHHWWEDIKQLTGQQSQTQSQLLSLASELTNGDLVQLSENINSFFHSISSDLQPVDSNCLSGLSNIGTLPDDLIIEPYSVALKLRSINVHKAPGPDDIPNWFLRDFSVLVTDPVCFIVNTSLKLVCSLDSGNRQMLFQFQKSTHLGTFNQICALSLSLRLCLIYLNSS